MGLQKKEICNLGVFLDPQLGFAVVRICTITISTVTTVDPLPERVELSNSFPCLNYNLF